MFRSGWDVLVRSTVNFIVSLNGIFVNRLVISKATKNVLTKLTCLSSSTNVKKYYKCESTIVQEGEVRKDCINI